MRLLTIILLGFLIHLSAYSHVDLDYPEGADKFLSNDTVTIRWSEVQAHVTSNWELYFSPDAGNTWIEISKTIPVADREYDWIVPAIATTKGRIKVVQNNEMQDYEDTSANFSIEIVQAVGEIRDDLMSFNIFPNPSKNITYCSFQLQNKRDVEIQLRDITGREIYSTIKKGLDAGAYEYKYSISNLSNGIYVFQFNIDGYIKTSKLIVKR